MPMIDGMALGLALIMPIGAQNLFIIQQGLTLGYPRVFYATLSTTACDALLITAGALGLAAVVQGAGPLRTLLIVLGGAFLLYLAWQNVRSVGAGEAADDPAGQAGGGIVTRAIGVSLLNPHAILDTVGVIGAVAATRVGVERAWFASGAVLGSFLWFSLLGGVAFAVADRLTHGWRRAIAFGSSAVMVFFAIALWSTALRGG